MDVDGYIESLEEPRHSQIAELDAFIRRTVPALEVFMAGDAMIGYGSYHYRYATGREGDSCIVGLSSRKNYISIYAMGGEGEQYIAEKYKARLPKADIGKACIRFKRLEDIDLDVLAQVLKESAETMEPLRNR